MTHLVGRKEATQRAVKKYFSRVNKKHILNRKLGGLQEVLAVQMISSLSSAMMPFERAVLHVHWSLSSIIQETVAPLLVDDREDAVSELPGREDDVDDADELDLEAPGACQVEDYRV